MFYQMHNISRDINDSLKYDIVALDVLENKSNYILEINTKYKN